VTADPAAREKFDGMGNPTGVLEDPTITLHTSADPLVLVQNQSVFRDRVYSAKGRTGDLVQLYTLPPASYSTEAGAPYGAGHCNFTTDERLAVVTILDDWVRKGQVPGAAAIRAAFGTDEGLNLNFFPDPWPAEEAS
jgi:hypothetical protein